MAKPKKPRHGKAPQPKRGPFRRFISTLFRVAVIIVLVAFLGLVAYLIHLDGMVREKFEGQRWALPARVYARPLDLYAGLPLTPEDLQGELTRLDYRPQEEPARAGSYARHDGGFVVRTRPFRFWDGAEPERFLEIGFEEGVISSLKNVEDGTDAALVRLDAAVIASIYPTHNEDRVLLRSEDIPKLLIDTLTSVEDRSFHTHFGVDPSAISRAILRNLAAGTVVEGGSTLTQQLIKNFYLSDERSLKRKVNEALMAMLLELHYTKDEILEAYANEIFLGQDGSRAIHGFGLASRFYFDRSLDELSHAQTALLVALIKGPSHYDPRRYPERAIQRRNLVVGMLVDRGVIDAETAATAKEAPLGVVGTRGGQPSGAYPAFLDLVRRQLQTDYEDEDLRSEGLRIFTTLSPLMQATVEAQVSDRLARLESRRGLTSGTLETAVVVASSDQGEVLALVGGRQAGFAGFNRALQAVRPIGSLVKPAIYLAALADPEHYSLATTLSDRKVNLPNAGQRWRPQNYDHRVHGNVPLYKALVKSYNLATVNLGMDLGLDRVVEMLNALGVRRDIDAVPAMLLGSVSLAPVEVAQVYQSLAAGGFRTPLKAIREVMNASGQPLNRYPLAVETAADPRSVYLVTWAMKKVVEQGTATWLKKRLPKDLVVAGKTGTTNDLRDSWFAGFSGDKVAVVWVGRDDNKPTKLTGSTGALRIWGDIMATVDNRPLLDFPPEGIQQVLVDTANGLRASSGCRRGMKLPFDADGIPKARSRCGGGGRTARRSSGRGGRSGRSGGAGKEPASQAAAPPARKQEPKSSDGGGFGGFMRNFFGD